MKKIKEIFFVCVEINQVISMVEDLESQAG